MLADLAGFAERYVHSDPASSLLKQRGFVEHVVTAIDETYRLRPPYSDNLNDLMNAEPFRQSVPEVVQNKLHAVRKAGNHAAHPRRPIQSDLSLDCLYRLFDVARWFYLLVDGGKRADTPTYAAPEADTATNGKAKEALEKLRLAEAKYESVLATLAEETMKRLEAGRVPIEIKPLGSYSLNELTACIANQLHGRYMQPADVKYGVLLLVRQTDKEWEVDGKRQGFAALVAAVRAFADAFGAERDKIITIATIDLLNVGARGGHEP